MTSFFSDPAYSVNITASGTEEWSEMVFSGSFDYDPSQGNLLVEIIVPNGANTSLHVSRTGGGGEGSRTYDTSRFGSNAGNTTATRMQFTFTAGAACPCACNFDTSTGPGVCDLVDFVTFAGQFAGGCP